MIGKRRAALFVATVLLATMAVAVVLLRCPVVRPPVLEFKHVYDHDVGRVSWLCIEPNRF
jgi:hypothetical protein